jgi:hypothetical protein
MRFDKLAAHLILILGLFCLVDQVRGQTFLTLQSKLISLREATAPEYFDGHIIFTYKANRPVKVVGARFEHESFNRLHIYERHTYEEDGRKDQVFFLVYTVPEEDFQYLKYRITVDGLWMTDPFNPNTISEGPFGVEYSYFEIRERVVQPLVNPQWEESGRATFRFVGMPGQLVAIAGDFNGWDPYRNPLKEDPVGSGRYSITLSVAPSGRQHYCFYIDGVRSEDPFNPNRLHDRDRNPVSYFENPY